MRIAKCNIETQSEQILWKNGANRFAVHGIVTNPQFVKNLASMKCNKVKYNKTRSTFTGLC